MSAFLGPIHTWLFRKIKFQDEYTKEILKKVIEKGYDKEILNKIDTRFGSLEEGELSEIIDGSNIHGWLQERISLVENRLAYVVTTVTNSDLASLDFILEVVYEFGKKHAAPAGISVKEAYEYLEDLLVNGMPCDHVNNVVSETNDIVKWEQTVDIHAPYWTMIQGNVQYYYAIRERLISGIFENSGITFKQENQIFELRKED